MSAFAIQRVVTPTEEQISKSADLFYDLMKDNLGAISLSGGDKALIRLQALATIRAGAFAGEYYVASNPEGELVGYSVWMPPGQELFSTEEQRKLGYEDYVAGFSEEGKEYFRTTYLAHIPGFINGFLGPNTGKKDSWWLHMAMVRPDYQRKGIARALIDFVRIKAEKSGDVIACATTNDDNVPVYVSIGLTHRGRKMMPSPWGDWPLHVFTLNTAETTVSRSDEGIRFPAMPQNTVNSESYALLASNEYDDESEKPKATPTESSTWTLAIVAGLVIFLMVDLIVFSLIGKMLLDARSFEDPEDMEFRNPYIGLDDLYHYHDIKPSHFSKVINEPRLSAQISPAEPNRVFPIDAHRWLSDFGVLSPPDRHFQVSNQIHTMVQFHILDYGMEKCTLAVRLPGRGDTLPHPYTLPTSQDVVRLNICELDVKRPLKERQITWSTRPVCQRQLGTIEAKVGEEVEMDPFSCKSGSFIGYQISCADVSADISPECNIDVWTNHNQTWGIFLNQYQTV
ncbi:hypothetical protein CPB84DRAFT_1824378 [Gymnopilus junonius]|uniref:N-acetyltransferase domain-containing protein n=1 Tax=Gymnopilus junonius TaxID=109634 RepID=A0A9P5TMY6_GYMJU|nr:hypothetical protein CPB84DRAFT_1824378 [Gymnopilus junonius]